MIKPDCEKCGNCVHWDEQDRDHDLEPVGICRDSAVENLHTPESYGCERFERPADANLVEAAIQIGKLAFISGGFPE